MANTQGTWRHLEARIGMQPISQVSTTANHPFGTIVRARDTGATAYGEGEFIYVKGVASGALNAWAGYNSKSGLTTLAVADGAYPVGVFLATLDATTDFGWLQIKGRCIGKCLTAYADNGRPNLTSTAGSVDDASVASNVVWNAEGRNGGTVTIGDLAGEFEINRPFTSNRAAPIA